MKDREYIFIDETRQIGAVGRRGEAGTRSLTFDCAEVLSEYPDAEIIAVIRRAEGDPYTVVPEISGDKRVVVLQSADMMYAGNWSIEVRAITQGEDGAELVRKSAIYYGTVTDSLYGEDDSPGEPIRDVLDRVEAVMAGLTDITAEAEGGETASASFDNETHVLSLVLPRGERGETGPAGETGPQGEQGLPGAGDIVEDQSDPMTLVVVDTTTPPIDSTLSDPVTVKKAKYLKLKDGSLRQFIPPEPEGNELGGVSAAEKAALARIGAYRLLHSETANGTSTFVRFDHDDDGNEFSVHEIIVKAEIPATQFNVRFDFYIHDSEWAWKSTGASTYGILQNAGAASYARIKLYNEAGSWICESNSNQYKGTANYTHRSYGDDSSPVADYDQITGVLMYIFGSNNIPSGTKFEFWGR